MSILRDTLIILRDLPNLIAGWCDRTVMDANRMTDVGEPGTPEPWCLRCAEAWPCDEYGAASDRVVDRSRSA